MTSRDQKCVRSFSTLCMKGLNQITSSFFNSLSAKPKIWSDTLKEFGGNLPTNCLIVFKHFVGLALEGLKHTTEII